MKSAIGDIYSLHAIKLAKIVLKFIDIFKLLQPNEPSQLDPTLDPEVLTQTKIGFKLGSNRIHLGLV